MFDAHFVGLFSLLSPSSCFPPRREHHRSSDECAPRRHRRRRASRQRGSKASAGAGAVPAAWGSCGWRTWTPHRGSWRETRRTASTARGSARRRRRTPSLSPSERRGGSFCSSTTSRCVLQYVLDGCSVCVCVRGGRGVSGYNMLVGWRKGKVVFTAVEGWLFSPFICFRKLLRLFSSVFAWVLCGLFLLCLVLTVVISVSPVVFVDIIAPVRLRWGRWSGRFSGRNVSVSYIL